MCHAVKKNNCINKSLWSTFYFFSFLFQFNLWSLPRFNTTHMISQQWVFCQLLSQRHEEISRRRFLGIPNLHFAGLNYPKFDQDWGHFGGFIWSYPWFRNPVSGYMILYPDPLPMPEPVIWFCQSGNPCKQSRRVKRQAQGWSFAWFWEGLNSWIRANLLWENLFPFRKSDLNHWSLVIPFSQTYWDACEIRSVESTSDQPTLIRVGFVLS